MNGFLFDSNLPARITFTPAWPVTHARSLGPQTTDSTLWDYARVHDLVIVTKDADFSHRIMAQSPPPRVGHLRIGNVRAPRVSRVARPGVAAYRVPGAMTQTGERVS